MRTKSKAPPFKKRRTGHPKFNYKARTTRPLKINKFACGNFKLPDGNRIEAFFL
jgi:hypothetical protein